MHIFLNEERAYVSWVAHHGHGFVLEGLRRPTRKAPVVHRASCEAVRSAKTKKTHFTTGRHYKACALELEELLDWAASECERPTVACEVCRPDDASIEATAIPRHLTKLGKDVVDYAVDVAVICLDEGKPYGLTVKDVADYLGKSPAQLGEVLRRLIDDGYLRVVGAIDPQKALSGRRKIFPTTHALCTLPFFQHLPVREVKAELDQLTGDEAE